MSLFKKFVPVKSPLNLLLLGCQGVGKSSCCASLLRKPTILLYSRILESHSPQYMAKACELPYYDGATPDNLLSKSIDVREEGDEQLVPACAKIPVGSPLGDDFALMKLMALLKHAKGQAANIVLDSMTAIVSIIKGTAKWRSMCLTKDGGHNSYAETGAFITIIQEIMAMLTELEESGMNCVTICGAKATELEQSSKEVTQIAPDLPVFGVIEKVVFFYPDIAVVTRKDAPPFTRMLSFAIDVQKASKTQDGKQIRKFMNVSPRLRGMPINVCIEELPPDLLKLDEYIEEAKQLAQE